jgi:transcription initiation factor TFIID TATA-box-binding protein
MRKRLYTPLQICSPAAPAVDDPQQTPAPVIHNIVSTAQIESTKMPMDLQAISEVLPGSSYDRRKFAAMTIQLANPSCTLLLFSSGKLVVTGGKSWYQGVLSCLRVARFLQRSMMGADFWLKSCDVQNVVAHVEIPMDGGYLDLEGM